MAKHTLSGFLFSILGILVSGLAGGVAGWWMRGALGWDSVGGALVAVVVGMVVATAVWLGLTVLLRALGVLR